MGDLIDNLQSLKEKHNLGCYQDIRNYKDQ